MFWFPPVYFIHKNERKDRFQDRYGSVLTDSHLSGLTTGFRLLGGSQKVDCRRDAFTRFPLVYHDGQVDIEKKPVATALEGEADRMNTGVDFTVLDEMVGEKKITFSNSW